MAFNASDYPEIGKASNAYDVAKSEFLKLDRQLDETPTTAKNYKSLVESRNAAKEKMDKALKNYQDISKKRRSDFEAEQKRLTNAKKRQTLQAKIKSLEDSRQRAADKGEATTAIDAAINKAQTDLDKILKGDVAKDGDGKIIPQGAPTGTVAEKPVSQTGFATNKSGVLLKDGQTYSGIYEGKTYKDGKVVTTPSASAGAKGGAGTGAGAGAGAGAGTGAGAGAGADAGKGAKGKLTFEEIFAKAQQTYGDIDEIFKKNDQLKKLLTDAVEKKFTATEFLNRLKGTDWWQTKAGTVRQRQFEMREYERQLDKLDKNALDYEQKLATLNSESAYGRGLQDTYDRVKAARDARGATFDDAEAMKIAKGLYNLAFEGNDLRINNKISEYISATGALKGQAGKDIQALRETARANGFDLEKDPLFSGQLTSWLKQIASGKPIEDFQQLIRDEAAKKQDSVYVRDLLRSGYNLDGVYGNYIARIASAFNIDPNTIKLDDPLLKGIFNDKGGITFSQFDALLRKDPRFGQTPAAGAAEDLKQSIADRAIALGIGKLSEADLAQITESALALGLGASSSLIDKLIRAKFTYTPGKEVTGAAGQALTQLRATAAANGFDLDKQFGTELNSWLTGLLEGESLDTYKAKIRVAAKNGLPDSIKAMLDQGIDLATIYSPYKNIMANVLEINPESITLNDPVLRSAITKEGEVSLYDYQRALRKDPRWQYTNNAREDVSNSVLGVLKDFGFQG